MTTYWEQSQVRGGTMLRPVEVDEPTDDVERPLQRRAVGVTAFGHLPRRISNRDEHRWPLVFDPRYDGDRLPWREAGVSDANADRKAQATRPVGGTRKGQRDAHEWTQAEHDASRLRHRHADHEVQEATEDEVIRCYGR